LEIDTADEACAGVVEHVNTQIITVIQSNVVDVPKNGFAAFKRQRFDE